jgi:hypothetical protein
MVASLPYLLSGVQMLWFEPCTSAVFLCVGMHLQVLTLCSFGVAHANQVVTRPTCNLSLSLISPVSSAVTSLLRLIAAAARELASELLEELHSDTTAAVDSLVAMELSGAFAVCRREFSRASNQHLEGLRTLITAAGSSPAAQPGNAAAADGAAAGERAAKASGGSSIKRRTTSEHGAGAVGSQQQVAGLYEPPTLLAPIPATATGPGELLSMMSVVLTYFGISCRRLADTVSMSIMHHLIGSFNSKFRARLAGQLLSLSSEAVGALLVEEPACAARRAALKQKKDLLEQAMKLMRAAG